MNMPNVRVCFEWEHLRRTSVITIVVGTWLTAFNHYPQLLTGVVDAELGVKVLLNYLTPFVVANAGLLSRQYEEE